MSAARKHDLPVKANVVEAASQARLLETSVSAQRTEPGVNALVAQRQLLERAFGRGTADVEVERYPVAIRLGLILGGAILTWAVLIGLIGAVTRL